MGRASNLPAAEDLGLARGQRFAHSRERRRQVVGPGVSSRER
jgi:hypothetical protein